MIIYSGTKQSFQRDVINGIIARRLSELFVQLDIPREGYAEFKSWQASLPRMSLILSDTRFGRLQTESAGRSGGCVQVCQDSGLCWIWRGPGTGLPSISALIQQIDHGDERQAHARAQACFSASHKAACHCFQAGPMPFRTYRKPLSCFFLYPCFDCISNIGIRQNVCLAVVIEALTQSRFW